MAVDRLEDPGHDRGVQRATRMVIEQLTMRNFKSYAGTRVIGPFHKRFSSIVGPNGSGKSNVIDALLFVFGKRATQIRLKKVSELIHNSENHQGLESATVSVKFVEIVDHIDHDDAYDVIEGSEIVISRTAFLNSTSKYFVNEKASTFTEVTTLLMTKGIDLDHNRFLILQGEVEQIAMMKPKGATTSETGILEYLEDIIGTHSYAQLIEDASKNVEDLSEQRQSKNNRVKLAEKERNSLESAKLEAEAYIETQLRLLTTRSKLCQLYVHGAESNINKAEENNRNLNEKLLHEQEKHAKSESELAKIADIFEQEKKEHSELISIQEGLQAEFDEFDRRDVQLKESMKHAQAKVSKLEKKLKKDIAHLQESKETIISLDILIPDLNQQLESVQFEKEAAEKFRDELFESVREQTEDLRHDLESKQKDLIPLRSLVNESQSRCDTTRMEMQIFSNKKEQNCALLIQTRDDLDKVTAQILPLESRLQTAESALKQNTSRVKAVRSDLDKIVPEIKLLEAGLNSSRSIIDESKFRLSTRTNRGQVLSRLEAARSAGTLPGIIGRLGDLGSIEPKYDVAISTACHALNHIVVDNIQTAQKAAALLREQRIGTATFICLDKIRHLSSSMDSIGSTPEGSIRLFELVTVNQEIHRVAFYFALRNTLVAADLDAATRIGYKSGARHRVVSLAGHVIDACGTMSGGGNHVQRGAMSSVAHTDTIVDQETVQRLTSSISEMDTKFRQLNSDRCRLEQTLEQCTVERDQVDQEIKLCTLDLQGLRQTKISHEHRLQSAQSGASPSAQDVEKISQLEQKLNEYMVDLKKAQKQAATMETKVASIEKAILIAGGTSLQKQIAELNRLTKLFDSIRTKLTKCEVDKSCALKGVQVGDQTIVSSKEAIDQAFAEVQRIGLEIEQITESALAVHDQLEEAQSNVQSKEKQLSSSDRQLQSLKKDYEIIRAVQLDIKIALDDCVRIKEDNTKKVSHWASRLNEIVEEIHSMENNDDNIHNRFALCGSDQLESLDKTLIEAQLTEIEQQLQTMSPNANAIEQYQQSNRAYQAHSAELQDLSDRRDQARAHHDQMRKTRLEEFMRGYQVITLKLKEMYQMLTLGGDAELELVDSLDPFSEGIVFSVRPPKKSWKNISNLSGGEKTLSSLALVFALHYYKPTPLYVMDEIDAALDFKNVSIVANYIKERTRDAQFIIISLRNNMFEMADRLVGIYKTDNASKSITINPQKFTLTPSHQSG